MENNCILEMEKRDSQGNLISYIKRIGNYTYCNIIEYNYKKDGYKTIEKNY